MFLNRIGPFGNNTLIGAIDNRGLPLNKCLAPYLKNIDGCLINGRLYPNWKEYVPRQNDRISILSKGGEALFAAIIMMAINFAVKMLIQALMPGPKSPKLDSKRAESFGIAGFNNTTGPGTPIMVAYGTQRMFGHVIASGAELSEDGYLMTGRVLYCLGDSGGDEYGSITNIEIDRTASDQFEEVVIHTRLGSLTQTVIPEFENVDQLWYVNTQLPYNEDLEEGTPIPYATHSNTVNRLTLFMSFPNGLWSIDSDGDLRNDFVLVRIEIKKKTDPVSSFAEVPGSPFNYTAKSQVQIFKKIIIDNLDSGGDGFDLRLTVIDQHKGANKKAHATALWLFNVQETEFSVETYLGYVLLGLTSISAKKIRSLESMRVSALVEGKRCKVRQPNGSFVLQHTRKRCWIVRDMMTHPVVGMGNDIEEAEIDDAQWQESQDYYDEIVDGQNGVTEVRDYCDFILNESRFDWEWIRSVAGEGRGCVFPANDKWKYMIDRPQVVGQQMLLYSCPGNIAENTLMMEIALPDEQYNQIISEYRDADNNYDPDVTPPITDGSPTSPVQKAIRWDTITRESQALRENMIIIKKSILEIRRWQFSSPMKALVSEPMDIDWMSERMLGDEGAYGVILAHPGTTTTVLLPEPVTLETGKVYDAIVHHQDDNTVEQRQVSTPSGNTYLEIALETALIAAPQPHDVVVIGERNVDHIKTRAVSFELDDEGRIKQARTEYIPAVYTADPLPPKATRKNFPFGAYPPIPLRDARVTELVVLNRDGSQRSVIHFDVTPGLNRHGGTVQSSTATSVVFDDEPMLDDYFGPNAVIRINGEEHQILDYIGAERRALVSGWTVQPVVGDFYEIEWLRFGTYEGFILEHGEELTDAPGTPSGYTEIIRVFGVHWERDGGDQRGSSYYRFTPFSTEKIENLNARPVRQVILIGDTSAPAAPASVLMSSHLKNVTIEVILNRPVAEDLSGIEIELRRNSMFGPVIKTIRVGAPADTETFGTMIVKTTVTLSSEAYNTIIDCQARAIDYSDNPSPWVIATAGTLLLDVQTNDIEPNAINTLSSFINNSNQNSNGGIVMIGTLTIVTTGGAISLTAKAKLGIESGGGSVSFYLRRGFNVGDTLLDQDATAGETGTVVCFALDSVPAGTYTYRVWMDTGSWTGNAQNVKLFAFEVKR